MDFQLKRLFYKTAKRYLVNRFRKSLSADPLNALIHFRYAVRASQFGLPYLAYAEMKTAKFLSTQSPKFVALENKLKAKIPDLEKMNHNQYFRFKSIEKELIGRSEPAKISILDVGGGEGELASFLPDASYCLAEPSINGISGTCLPFPDRSFDYVVACHVLEHIHTLDRQAFLDQLLAKSRIGVILLNPFQIDNTFMEERLKLVIEVTNAQWAKEHLECRLPKIEDIKSYASERLLECKILPNGTLTTTMAIVFMEYFGQLTIRSSKVDKVNKFFNQHFLNFLDSNNFPTAYLVYMSRRN